MTGFRDASRAGRQGAGRDAYWPLFAQGGSGDRAKPNAWQVMVLNDLSGADGRCAGATDDEVFGVLGQWRSVGCWVEGRKLAIVRELIRRRPHERNAGVATESGLPWDWDDRLAREISLRLGVSVPAARKLTWVAWALEARLPQIGKALDEGRIDPGEARTVVEETNVLDDPDLLARAEELILAGLAKCKTWADLLRLVQRAVVTVDPEGARKRREQEEKENARVRFWREAAGTCALMGAGLPADEALQANARVDQRAQQYRAAGVRRPIDILRVAAYLDLLNLVPAADRIARFKAEDAASANDTGPAEESPRVSDDGDGSQRPRGGQDAPGGFASDNYPWDCPPDDGFPVAEDPCARCSLGFCPCRDEAPPEPRCAGCGCEDCRCGGSARDDGPARGDGPGSGPRTGPGGDHGGNGPGGGSASGPGTAGQADPAVAAEVNLTLRHLDIPFLTAAGRVQRPGEARSLGVLDPALARKLAEAAARHPNSKFCLTIVDQEGRAVAHGCCKPLKQRAGPAPPAPSTFTLTPSDSPGPPGGYGAWILALPRQAAQYRVDLHPVPTGECGHEYESARHDPSDLLRHLVNVRDGKCGFPTCSRHARESDFEHATPHDKGGRTCGCNCWSCSRSCHQLKQSDGWEVTETRPGYHRWTTPSGRTYTQEPWTYPA